MGVTIIPAMEIRMLMEKMSAMPWNRSRVDAKYALALLYVQLTNEGDPFR
jgi:hypothetical protein